MEDGKLYCCYCKNRGGYIRDIDGFRIAGTKRCWENVIPSESGVYTFDELKMGCHEIKGIKEIYIPKGE